MEETRPTAILITIASVAALLSFARDGLNTWTYAGVDLRGYLIGGRLLLEGRDPYFFDAANHMAPSYSVTLPPTLLLFYGTLADLFPQSWRGVYFVLQWAALLMTLRLLTRSEPSETGRALVWAYGLLFFAGTEAWALHVERGQKYIFFALLLAAAFDLTQRGGMACELAAGAVLGVGMSVRPPLVAFLLAPILMRRARLVIGAVAGAGAGVGVSLLVGGLAAWRSYLEAMALHLRYYLGDHSVRFAFGSEERAYTYAPLVFTDSSLLAVWSWIARRPPPVAALVLAEAVLMLAWGAWVYRHRVGREPNSSVFLAGSVVVVVGECFLPAPRYSYADVMLLVPIALILGSHARHLRSWTPAGLLLVTGTMIGATRWASAVHLLVGEAFVAAYVLLTSALVLRSRATCPEPKSLEVS